MKIKLITVGKIKEKFFKDAIAEYTKRLSGYCQIEIIEVADEKTPDGASANVCEQIKRTEGERILSHIKDNEYVLAFCIKGKDYDSEGLASHLDDLMLHGNSTLTFVIGGSLGLSPEVENRADERLSFSKLTFPHQLMRVIALEQIYRCFRIIKNEPYHK